MIDLSPENNNNARNLEQAILGHLFLSLGQEPDNAKDEDWLHAAVLAVRDRIMPLWLKSARRSYSQDKKRVYYLSLEFLIGRMLRDSLQNLNLLDEMQNTLRSLGLDFDLIAALEPDAALGNGGLGRLAACFMDSLASLGIPAYGYGIRYRHGLFKQAILNCEQQELPELWIEHGSLWGIARRRRAFEVGFQGFVTAENTAHGRAVWKPSEVMLATAHDHPVVGWANKCVNTLRLWQARPTSVIDLTAFNAGDHIGAQQQEIKAEALNRVLYPSDTTEAGQELRLRQQFFFVSASLQDMIRRHLSTFPSVKNFADVATIQLNDTHPSIAVAELIRILVDVHGLTWTEARLISTKACSYTNHTLLPEALESWPVSLMERLLPRHMQIIYAINSDLIDHAHSRNMTDFDFLREISIIDEDAGKRVRMGNLAMAATHSTNGVSELHTSLMKKTVFRSLNLLFPDRINNKTNGVSPRRWFQQANPELAQLVGRHIRDDFRSDHSAIAALESLSQDRGLQDELEIVRRKKKTQLAAMVKDRTGIVLDPTALFDVQVKRIHEYKRQLMAVLEAIAQYLDMKSNPRHDYVPRVKLFAGKAAASYWEAKTIIRLINDVGSIINSDQQTRDFLKVAFVPDYNVSTAEVIIPAADLSEQISTAGMEASGTGNMKFAMNGALTIGTLDGANVEISEHVGRENIFIFGLTADQVAKRRTDGHLPRSCIASSPNLMAALDAVADGLFSPSEPVRYKGLVERLTQHDWFMVTADFDPYLKAQDQVSALWRKRNLWLEKSILNIARTGWFSSDRTIGEYARTIWGISPE